MPPGPVTAAVADGVAAAAVAGVLSGVPSTLTALVRRSSPLEAVRAAGTLLLPADAGPGALVVAGAAAHVLLSLGWGTLFALALPSRGAVPAGAAAGLAVAALDLGTVGRRHPRIRALPALPQVADHAAFGALVGAVVTHRRRRRQR